MRLGKVMREFIFHTNQTLMNCEFNSKERILLRQMAA